MNLAALYRKHLPLIELSLRVYIAYYLFDYGIAKLTGGMFNNASPAILRTPLQDVDLFHLTWYFFYKSKLLSYTAGICQMLAAVLLLFNRTVLLACMIALPVMVNVLIVDISVFPGIVARVVLYIVSMVLFILYRRQSVMRALAYLTDGIPAFKSRRKVYLLWVPVLLVAWLVVEVVLCRVLEWVF